MEHKYANRQGYNRYDCRPQQKFGGRFDIRDEPSEGADIRYNKNSQPDLEIGNLFSRHVQFGHNLSPQWPTRIDDTRNR